MLMNAARRWLSAYTLRSGRLVGLYRRLCRPDGAAWGEYLRRHGGLHALGAYPSIQANVVFTDPALVRIGNNVHMTGCIVFGHDGSVAMIKRARGIACDRVGAVEIRDNVFVGHQSIIMPGVCIGPDAIVAAGSVVTRDVPPNSIVAGVPARVVGSLDAYVERLQRELPKLPWCAHPQMQADYFGPPDPALAAQRVAHFFAAPGAAKNQLPAG